MRVCVCACVRKCMFCIAYWCAVYCGNLPGDPFVYFFAIHTGHNYHSPIAATKDLTDTLKKVLEEYKNNLPAEARTTLIDVLSRSDLSEAKAAADILSVFVGGFHTSGTCEWVLWKLLEVEDILKLEKLEFYFKYIQKQFPGVHP